MLHETIYRSLFIQARGREQWAVARDLPLAGVVTDSATQQEKR